ncbi:nucleotide exchange factor GrpE [Paenibacillus chungangensis]|uniref:Protein GrpE n=1 Tax=Paenibacillus chungangensis TaxID=696535 RepID=A0ABW3HM90_9BACL
MSTKEQHQEGTEAAAEEVKVTEAEEMSGEAVQQEDEQVDEADVRYVELQKQVEDNHQKYLRAQADFDNFRRRTMREKEELGKYASMKLITELLPTVDNFDRAMAATSENGDYESLAKGIDMIFRQLMQTLEQEGLKGMNAVGEPFNPEFHQAIMQVESDEYEEGIVVEEVQKGYMLKDKVLRPAMVKVSG